MQFNPSGSRTPWDASWHSPACTFASSLLCRLGCRRRHVGLVVFHRGAPLLRRPSALRFLVLLMRSSRASDLFSRASTQSSAASHLSRFLFLRSYRRPPPASMVNQKPADLGVPNRFRLNSSRFSCCRRAARLAWRNVGSCAPGLQVSEQLCSAPFSVLNFACTVAARPDD